MRFEAAIAESAYSPRRREVARSARGEGPNRGTDAAATPGYRRERVAPGDGPRRARGTIQFR